MGFGKHRRILEKGSRAPDFSLADLQGEVVSARQILSRGPALFAFFKISCPVCQLTLPFLERFHRQLDRGVLQVFGISQNDEGATRRFGREFDLTLPMLLDTSASGYPVSNGFGISQVPSMFLVEQDGTIAWASEGFSKQDLEDLGHRFAINPFRADEEVPAFRAG
ncbi:MAG TPA: TlpA disulfide reductase family protein [Bryobacteraceae bacterium]|nr:TlpA disulfide reductase family protein [Bryobacteraceae bacterium]